MGLHVQFSGFPELFLYCSYSSPGCPHEFKLQLQCCVFLHSPQDCSALQLANHDRNRLKLGPEQHLHWEIAALLQKHVLPEQLPCNPISWNKPCTQQTQSGTNLHWVLPLKTRERANNFFSNYALVKAMFEAPAIENRIFESSNLVSTKTLLLKYRLPFQGRPSTQANSVAKLLR